MSMSTYVHPEPPAGTQIVALGIRDTNYFLSCHMDGEAPVLRVEVKAASPIPSSCRPRPVVFILPMQCVG